MDLTFHKIFTTILNEIAPAWKYRIRIWFFMSRFRSTTLIVTVYTALYTFRNFNIWRVPVGIMELIGMFYCCHIYADSSLLLPCYYPVGIPGSCRMTRNAQNEWRHSCPLVRISHALPGTGLLPKNREKNHQSWVFNLFYVTPATLRFMFY